MYLKISGCNFYGFSGAVFGLLSINTMTVISVDRYLVIVKPYSSVRRLSYKQAYVLLAIAWSNAVCWSMPPLFGWSSFVLEGLGTTCTFDYLSRDANSRSYLICLYICGFVLPVLLIVFCYSYIFHRVRKHEKAFLRASKRLNMRYIQGAKEATRRTDIKTARTAMVAFIVFCAAWSPYAIMALIGQFGDRNVITPFVSTIPGILAKSSTIYNPVIYSISHPRFRRKLRYLYSRMRTYSDTQHLDPQTHLAALDHSVTENKLHSETCFCQDSGTMYTRTLATYSSVTLHDTSSSSS